MKGIKEVFGSDNREIDFHIRAANSCTYVSCTRLSVCHRERIHRLQMEPFKRKAIDSDSYCTMHSHIATNKQRGP